MRNPLLTLPVDAVRELAEQQGVCVRPVVHEVADQVTGRRHLVPTLCGATLASRCGPCAHRNRVLRMQQCREGWHLEEEPEPPTEPDDQEQGMDRVDDDQCDEPEQGAEEGPGRRVRSTRRRGDAPGLPRLPVADRTVGRAFTTASGRTYRPSMFATFTLPSYGRVRSDGTPVDPEGYDYRRAALDALHFPKLVDRFWQNLRRAVGYNVQYFAVVEPQRRLAPHLHAAVRGAIPRATFRTVVAATYHQVWWPAHDQSVYPEHDPQPVWADGDGYVDPASGVPLPTWAEALDQLDQQPATAGEEIEDAGPGVGVGPAHVLRFGAQMDLQGIIATEGDADRRVGYLTKYLAKTFGDAYASGEGELTGRQRRHVGRLLDQLRVLPCSPRCWNWLAYGIQPQHAGEGMTAGACPGKAHDGEHLGCGGRRVLVSRRWTGKTLDRHRADRAEVVRQVLAAAGVDVPERHRLAADTLGPDGRPRFVWKVWNPLAQSTPVYRQVMSRAIAEKLRWRREYQAAKQAAGEAVAGTGWARAGPHPPGEPW